ncbi:MAG: iron ABC transporter substrate-binding protein [Thermodesulfobacteriota bacterium]|nr:MAG: iron ABC transporter substrate-binding protein [Thermodesulfobacteriota bacterium]
MKRLISLLFVLLLALGCAKEGQKEVVVYTSVDQVFSEPILKDFEKKTGIKVKAVYDVEATKTVGLVNRLMAEKENPKCDVFWNNEIVRTIVLKKKGVLTPYNSPSAEDIPSQFKDKDYYWTGFAARARVLIYNTKMLKETGLPKSIFELTEPKWKGKVALAYPLFGTTATHIAALYAILGREKAEEYLKALNANKVVIVDGNSVARDMVVKGKLPLAFTDTDDANVAIQSGKPVKMIYPDSNGIGTLLIPNTVALIKGCPHPDEGKKLIDYLLSKEVESKLAFCESANMPIRDGVKKPLHVPEFSSIKAMEIDYYKVAENLDRSARFCQGLFVR